MINDFDLVVFGIVCTCDRFGMVKSNAITQKVRHSYNLLWFNLYLYPKWFDKSDFDQVAKLLRYLFRKPFFKRRRFRLLYFCRCSCSAWFGGRGSSGNSSTSCSSPRLCSRRRLSLL